MKKLLNNDIIYSPTDLISFLKCNHLSWSDHKTLTNELKLNKIKNNPFTDLLVARGLDHELNYLKRLKSTYNYVVEISRKESLQKQVELTSNAISSGADIIFQPLLYDYPWSGYADFLIKTNTPSSLGDFSYEILDAKLAFSAKPEHILQLCMYSELLSNTQDLLPEKIHLLLGNQKTTTFNLSDYFYYYLYSKNEIEVFVEKLPAESYPQPCKHCNICSWREHCNKQWEIDNHLSIIANIQTSQTQKLNNSNIYTVESFAKTDPDIRIDNLNQDTRLRLQSQAKLQTHKAKTGEDKVEILPLMENKGFKRLPKPNKGDLFFDIEGDPLYPNGGLEYLFGISTFEEKSENFQSFWAHDHDQEKKMFKEFMSFIQSHLNKYPDAYIYHYNHYENTVLKRLACRYGIFEEELDNLLRQSKLVDLYKVVRESIRTSQSGYSLKDLEIFYMEKRKGAVDTADMSILFYNQWSESQDPNLLKEISEYNKIDCKSTYLLREWLISLKPNNSTWFEDTNDNDKNNQDERKDWEIDYDETKNALEQIKGKNKDLAREVSNLLEFHKREEKVEWWEAFERQQKYTDELIDDLECIGDLVSIGIPVPEKKSMLYKYKFPPQEFKLRDKDPVINVSTMEKVGQIFKIYHEENILTLKYKESKTNPPLPENLSIGPTPVINSKPIRDAIYRYANTLINNVANTHQCVTDLLNKSIPRITNKHSGDKIITSNELLLDAKEAIQNLDNSYLFIQGPPGTGKTYSSSHIIVELMKQGKKVGITSNSHKAIHNMLEKIESIAMDQNYSFAGIKKVSEDMPETYFDSKSHCIFNLELPKQVEKFFTENNSDLIAGLLDGIWDDLQLDEESKKRLLGPKVYERMKNGEQAIKNIPFDTANLFAGTAWLFSRPDFHNQLDYLFIDEAGQVSLANTIAMGTAAKNIVLVGDQMQLAQPIKGTHPGNAGLSVLEYLLGNKSTIPPEQGIFLDKTWRLHPDISDFISPAFYDNRLITDSITKKRKLILKNTSLPPTGINLSFVEHNGCTQKSVEEGEVIKKNYLELLGQQFQDENQINRSITEDDIIIVTPYNVQVNYLKSILPQKARVGTVDKFQGQEAPIVLISMVTSNYEDIPRGMDFLYSKNRLNVALSRAQCLAILIINPNLLQASCQTIEQMDLLNKFCGLQKYTIGEYIH